MSLYAPYVLPDEDNHPATIAKELLKLPEFEHLIQGEANIRWLLRTTTKIKDGREILGTCYLPTVQGELKDMFEWLLHDLFGEMPDFLIVLDFNYWGMADARQREILVFHELMHAGQKVDQYGAPRFTQMGSPVWCIKPHSVEEFTEVVARYGAHNKDIKEFILAADGRNNEEKFQSGGIRR
jgi:hypothetical protein